MILCSSLITLLQNFKAVTRLYIFSLISQQYKLHARAWQSLTIVSSWVTITSRSTITLSSAIFFARWREPYNESVDVQCTNASSPSKNTNWRVTYGFWLCIWPSENSQNKLLTAVKMLRYVFICPIAIAYSMGQIIKSVCVCVCVCVCLSLRLRALSRSHFLIDFHQNWHRRKNPEK